MAKRETKEKRVKFASTMKEDLFKKLQDESADTDIPMTKLLDRAVEAYFDKRSSSK